MTPGRGWLGLFKTAFKHSRNGMVLLDDQRLVVDVNTAFLELLGVRRADVVGHHAWEHVMGGPLLSAGQWRVAMSEEEFSGVVRLRRKGDSYVTVQFAGHPEEITGRHLVLVVALSTAHARRRLAVARGSGEPLSEREREVVRLIGQGATGPEIARELHISHNTVRTHAHNAMLKLGARSRAHLVAKALGQGHVAA